MDVNVLEYTTTYDNLTKSYETIATYENLKICYCKIVYIDDKEWQISAWFTKHGYGNQGIGKKVLYLTLKAMFDDLGIPDKISYIWNGANSYVLDYISKNFDAICNCPIAIQKYQSEDDWDSHIYTLNKNKVLNYFQIG